MRDLKPKATNTNIHQKAAPFFGGARVFPKLTINAPNDAYEQQADAMANRVMRMEEEEEQLQAMPLEGALQRKCAACEEEEENIQSKPLLRKAEGHGGQEASPELAGQLDNSKGGGAPLPDTTQARMGRAFGADFGNVRVHTGRQAAAMSRSIQAKAFTHGSDIYFNEGQYQPETRAGGHLLAHELTHVAQQTNARGMVQRSPDGPEQPSPDPSSILTPSPLHPENQPSVTRRSGPNSVDIMYQSRNYTVRRRLVGLRPTTRTVSGEPPNLSGGADRENVWLQVSWCEGQRHRGRIQLGADVPASAVRFLRNVGQAVIGGDDPGTAVENFDLNAFLELELQVHRAFQLRARGTTRVADPTSPNVPQAGARIELDIDALPFDIYGEYRYERIPTPGGGSVGSHTGTVGASIPLGRTGTRVQCPTREVVEYVPEYRFECVEHIPEGSRTIEESAAIHFEYATDVIATHNSASGRQRREENEIAASQNDRNLSRIETLLNQGFRISSIRGLTSPEGPRQQLREGGFQGNQALSEQRAEAARLFVQNHCTENNLPNCFAQNFTMTGAGESPTLDDPQTGAELEGAALSERTTEHFLTSETESSRRTEQLAEELRGADPQRRATLVYPLLRRAEITFVREETVPARDENMESCPSLVEAAAARFLD